MLIRSENLLGRTVAGYRLLEILGRGGMSVVFLAQRLDNPQDHLAIKVLLPYDTATAEEFVSFQARFLREAQATYQMHQEHILPVLGYGVEDGLFYMVMPVISGGTLATRLASAKGPLSLDEIARYLNQLASAVDYANQRGMIHRDIKPSNALIDEQGNVYLVDFGIVHLFDKGPYALDQAPTTLTTTGQMFGTPAYMAPERFKGERAVPATDIYALGILLYQLVTGQVPFKADNPLAIGMKHLSEEPRPPRSLRPDLPEPAEKAILKALAKQPAARFSTASALAVAFEAGLRGQWAEELLALPPVVPIDLMETHKQQPLAPVVAVPEGPPQPGPLVLGPEPTFARGEVPVPFAPTQANAAPVARPERRSWSGLQILATVALVVAILLLVGLIALGGFLLGFPSAGSANPVLPTSTSTGVTPTPTLGVTPSPSPAATPTPTATPQPTPTPTPGVTPTPSPTAAPTPTPTSAPLPTPTP